MVVSYRDTRVRRSYRTGSICYSRIAVRAFASYSRKSIRPQSPGGCSVSLHAGEAVGRTGENLTGEPFDEYVT